MIADGALPAPFTPVVILENAEAIPTPPDGAGLIVFFRRSRGLPGGGFTDRILFEDGTEIGRLSIGARVVYATTPGIHEFEARPAVRSRTPAHERDRLRLEIEPGLTYFAIDGARSDGSIMLIPSDDIADLRLPPPENSSARRR